MRQFEIAPVQEGKGRTFRALCLATVEADTLWSGGMHDDTRPVWVMFAGSENELRPFVSNLTLGRKAQVVTSGYSRRGSKERMELLRSARYTLTYQRESEGLVATAFLADLFRLDPGMVDPDGARFILMPTQEWLATQNVATEAMIAHVAPILDGLQIKLDPVALATLATTSYLFAAYLDRRTRLPLVADGRFYLQLLLACLTCGFASFAEKADARGYSGMSYGQAEWGTNKAMRFFVDGLDDVGLLSPIAFNARHEPFGEVLAEEVAKFFHMTEGANG